MTIAELIAHLSNYPEDTLVQIGYNGFGDAALIGVPADPDARILTFMTATRNVKAN